VTIFLAVLTSRTLNDLKLFPPKNIVWCLGVFCVFRLRCTLQKWIATKWLEIDQDNVRTGTAKAVARLLSIAQITCSIVVTGTDCGKFAVKWLLDFSPQRNSVHICAHAGGRLWRSCRLRSGLWQLSCVQRKQCRLPATFWHICQISWVRTNYYNHCRYLLSFAKFMCLDFGHKNIANK